MIPKKLSFTLEGQGFSSIYDGFHGPLDNIPLSHEDLSSCRAALDRCRRIALEAPAVVRSLNLDPEIALRGGNWGIDKVAEYFDRLTAGSEMSINHLRLLTYLFTGNRLYDFSAYNSTDWSSEVPVDLPESVAELDRRIRANEHKLLELNSMHSFLITSHKHPEVPLPRVPPMFGEVGWVIDGVLFNDDVYANYTYLQGLHRSGILRFLENRLRRNGRLRIVEVGPGWGCLAYNLKRLFPGVEYVFVDIPESIVYAYLYISTLFKTERNVLVESPGTAPGRFDSLFVPSHVAVASPELLSEVDLAINTNSLAEMHPKQIDFYAATLSRGVGQSGVFFEQNFHLERLVDSLSFRFGYRRSVQLLEQDRFLNVEYRGKPNIWFNGFQPDVHEFAKRTPTK